MSTTGHEGLHPGAVDDAWWSFIERRNAYLWRGVEAQHIVSTMKLVDSVEEQAELERILEASKPPAPPAAHYLIATPFRYPSPHASRFRPAHALGVWYGAETVTTACTELGYWRWRFLNDSDGLRATELIVTLTLFSAGVYGMVLDLSETPWDSLRADWISDNYDACHWIANAARQHGVQWLRYWSARHVEGHCGAVFDPASIGEPDLTSQQTWHCKVTATRAFMNHGDESLTLEFG